MPELESIADQLHRHLHGTRSPNDVKNTGHDGVQPIPGDYEVLLLSRIREEYLRTGDANTSVADGVASTARVITAAAAIMVVVFASFTLERRPHLVRVHRGRFDFSVAYLGFHNRVVAYLLLLRDEYPSTDEEQTVHLQVPYPTSTAT